MKINSLVASVRRLQFVKNRAKFKASINHNNKELKTHWMKLSKEAEELLKLCEVLDISESYKIADLCNKEWRLYLKMKVLTNKHKVEIENLEESLKKIEEVELIDNE
jgi:signal transduction histidine kinase